MRYQKPQEEYILTLQMTETSAPEVERTTSARLAYRTFEGLSREGVYAIYVDKVVGGRLVRQMSWGPEVRAALGIKKKRQKEITKKQVQLFNNPSKKKRSSKKRASKRRTRAFQIQSVLLEIDSFTPARAKAWLKAHGHKYGDLEESERFYHARQHSPGDYQHKTLHNIQLAKHVEAVVGIPIEGSEAAEARGYNKRGPRQAKLALPKTVPYKGYSEEYGF